MRMTPTERGAVLVTGASRGIGEACALRLGMKGFRVFAGVRRPADGEKLRGQASAGLVPVILDVADPDTIAETAETIAEATGGRGLAGVVNNAGIAVAGPLEHIPIEDFRHQLEVNVVGQLAVTQAVLPQLRQVSGRIVFIGSVAGRSALPFVGPYSASKFALEALADSLRVELAPFGIRVALVEPGAIATSIWSTSIAAGEERLREMPTQVQHDYGRRLDGVRRRARQGMGGLPPGAVADAVEHALTAAHPRARYVVGRNTWLRIWLEWLPDGWRDRIIARQLDQLSRS